MKKALLIGINHYSFGPLNGPINDVQEMAKWLGTHDDGSPNYDCKLLTSTPDPLITDSKLRKEVKEFFTREADSAILYFSGHGSENTVDGYLVSQNATIDDPGLAFSELMKHVSQSKIPEINIILDCCHAGHLANWSTDPNGSAISSLREGISILSSSRGTEYSVERGGKGLFTSIICDALKGGAADVKGDVSIAGLYAYADQLLGPWDQRPLFKSHVSRIKPIRKCSSKVDLRILRGLPNYFEFNDSQHQLDPSYEPTCEPKDQDKEAIFSDLQELVSVGLVAPVDEEHMYYAAINEKSCELTLLGKFYWKLAKEKKI
ncbi:MAG: caspase family protein [Bacteroidota bacterium]